MIMKKLFLLAILSMIIADGLYAQKVGVNITSPAWPLHVREASGTTLTSSQPVFLSEYGGTNTADVIAVKGYSRPGDYYGVGGSFEGGWIGLEGKVVPVGSSYYTGVSGSVTGGSGINYGLYGSASGSGTNWAGYFASGNVYVNNKLGIGQLSPQWPIDISSSQAVVNMVSTSSVFGSVMELKNTAASPVFLGAINFNNAANTYPGQIGYASNHIMNFRTNGQERMTIDQYGNVNIGAPTLIGTRLNVDGGLGKFNAGIAVYDYTGGANNTAVYAAAGGATNTNWAGYFYQGNVYVADDVRIGTTSGATGYKVSVAGKVMCEELKVQLQANWPDYVFAREYELKPLHEVENEIRRTGHLPGVPSAGEIQSNGLEVGEMQRIMMEKIEELTLYMIDLQKENTAIKEELARLKEKAQ